MIVSQAHLIHIDFLIKQCYIYKISMNKYIQFSHPLNRKFFVTFYFQVVIVKYLLTEFEIIKFIGVICYQIHAS